MRIGIGYDSHRFCEGDCIYVGGVPVPADFGVEAHSDGDVLLHALCDALLGALALGDIGQHFPDSDPKYKGVSSIVLLESVMQLVMEAGYVVSNIDSTVICENPKLKPYIPAMQRAISSAVHAEVGAVSVKATTNEKMGFVGREEGLVSHVVVLLEKCNSI